MGIVSLIFDTWDAIFEPVLALGALPSIVLFSLGLALLFTFFYWLLVDKEEFQKAKQKLKDKQQEAKEAQEEGNDEEAAELMKETFSLQKDFMLVSAKPMMATFVFVALFFPWLGATYSPGVEMEATGENIYTGELELGPSSQSLTVDNSTGSYEVEINGETLEEGDRFEFAGVDWQVAHFGEPRGFFSGEGVVTELRADFIPMPINLPIIGEAINWLGLYILITIPVSIVLRKTLGLS